MRKPSVKGKVDFSAVKAAHFRAARAYLGWKLVNAQEKSGVSLDVISRFERGKTANATEIVKEKLYNAYLNAGVEIKADGLRVV